MHGRPGGLANRFLVIFKIRESHVEVRVYLHNAHKSHLQQGDILRAEQSG